MKPLSLPARIATAVGFALAVCAAPILSQNPTGTLVGSVLDADRGALPGVAVTATSPQLQGERSTHSGPNGSYKLAFLPPGEYRVTYELEGFSTVVRVVKINAAQTATSDIELGLSEVVEEIVVTSNVETISQSRQAATTYDQSEIEKLAISRDITSSVELTPGVHSTAPASGDAITISGAMSFENLWLINGVVVNENVRGESLPLFIEDAVQETTTSVAGISAEYGRFTGGVINVITKSGGNEISGSLRVNFDNDDWESETPLSGERVDDVNREFETTLGGPFWKDHVWFFGAGRRSRETGTDQTSGLASRGISPITFDTTDDEDRVEGKLTLSFGAGRTTHSVIGSYLEIDQISGNDSFANVLDLASLIDREDPQELRSLNYAGVLSPQFFAEAQYSERTYAIAKGAGGIWAGPPSEVVVEDLVPGTMLRHAPTSRRFHAPTFCGSCPDEIRDNENTLLKGSYFLASESMGTHDVVFGYDTFTDIRFSVNHQTGSDWQIWASDIVVDGSTGEIFPVLRPDGGTDAVWFPPLNEEQARPTDFTTNSFYVNDSWQLNENWSFNVGVRYDENDGQDSGGALVVDDQKISPRLGLTWDLRGDGSTVVNASYGTYVAAIANTIADGTSTGGALSTLAFTYLGEPINDGCTGAADCLSTEDVLRTFFNDYVDRGGIFDGGSDPARAFDIIAGIDIYDAWYRSIPGSSAIVPDTLVSPSADELTIGVTHRLGSKGLARADVVYREWQDFYSDKTTKDIQVDAAGNDLLPGGDLVHIGNFGDSVLERDYLGVNLQARYRLSDRLTLAGNYTWSKLRGNVDGETENNGPTAPSPLQYPELTDPSFEFPVGYLTADQRHKVRMWAVYDLLQTEHHNLSVSLLQSYFSGTPYGAAGGVDARPFADTTGYETPPNTTTYFFTARDAFRTDDVTRTDVALNYAWRFGLFGKSVEVFFQPEVLNVFDEDAVNGILDIDTTVNDETSPGGGSFETFDPFHQTPIEGVHWEKGPEFGQPTHEDAYQTPRTFRFSVGFRF